MQFNLSLLIKQAFKLFLTDEYDVLYDVESKTDEIPHTHAIFFLLYKLFLEKIDILKVWLLHMYNN